MQNPEPDCRAGLVSADQPDLVKTPFGEPEVHVRAEDGIQLALDTIPAMVHTAQLDGSCDYFNQRWLDYLGASLDDIKGWRWTSRIHPDDLEGHERKWREAVTSGKPHETEVRFRRADGQYRWHLARGVPLRDEEGNIVKWYGVLTDIDDRKCAEEALKVMSCDLKESKAKLEEAQRITHVGYWEWDLATGHLTWAEEMYRIFGLEPQEHPLDLAYMSERIHPEDREFVFRTADEAVRKGARPDIEHRIVRPTGEVRIVHSQGDVKKDASGLPYQMFGTTQDVTDRKRAEQELGQSEAYLSEAQRLSHTGSWGWNASTGKVVWSQEHFRILGLDPHETTPSADVFWKKVHPDDRIGLQRAFESAIRDKRDFEREFRIIMPDSSIRHLHGVGHAILNKANELVEFMGSTMDITERKRAEAALQEARAELERVSRVTTMGELAASIAHEVNQPLAGVVASANAGLNWLSANPPNLSKTRETLERIRRDGTRGGEVLARIRAVLKRTPPAKTLVSVNQIVRDVLALSAGELRQNSIELLLELAPALPGVCGDSIQLQQVLLNLIKNASEAMAEIANGQRTLRIQSRLGELDGRLAAVVEVSDTGVGFSNTEPTRLFEAFHTTKPQGMGMGLWISRSIIENHEGRLTASAGDGPGATFVIMLPTNNQGLA